MTKHDRELGMGRAITRRDFVQGVAMTAAMLPAARAAALTAAEQTPASGSDLAAIYPPVRTGMRGSHPGSFEAAHATRDGRVWDNPDNTGETYDLVVVGGGMSGLSAAYFFRKMSEGRGSVLVLDNHDDFGGHAKRNEFVYKDRIFLATGGTAYMVHPSTYPPAGREMLREIGVDIHGTFNTRLGGGENGDDGSGGGGRGGGRGGGGTGLGSAVFFDKETFGADALIYGGSLRQPTPDFLAKTPLSPAVRADLLRLMTESHDYLAGMTAEQKIQTLSKTSYRDYLLNCAKVDPGVLPLVGGVWCLGQDTCSAWFAYFRGSPGFNGLGVKRPGYPQDPDTVREPEVSFPAGNSDIARMIVRWLIPDALPKGSMEAVETTRVDYSKLDVPNAPVRIRLSSIAVRVRHVGDSPSTLFENDKREVDVTYVRDGRAYKVRAKSGVVLACNNAMIPYLCPEMPDAQKDALHMAVRAVNQQTHVLVNNWRAFDKMKLSSIAAPGCFYISMSLGSRGYGVPASAAATPDEPRLVGLGGSSGVLAAEPMVRGLKGGKPTPTTMPLRDQLRELRAALLATPFELFERKIREQMARILGPGGFDPARDIEAITVNRWPHGFALGLNSLFDPDRPDDEAFWLVGRKPYGRITVANSDASGIDLTQTAFNEAHRAVSELMPRNYGYFGHI